MQVLPKWNFSTNRYRIFLVLLRMPRFSRFLVYFRFVHLSDHYFHQMMRIFVSSVFLLCFFSSYFFFGLFGGFIMTNKNLSLLKKNPNKKEMARNSIVQIFSRNECAKAFSLAQCARIKMLFNIQMISLSYSRAHLARLCVISLSLKSPKEVK